MIKEVSGDILLSKSAAIVHGVAPNDDFKQGLALELRDRWPGMYKDFRHYCRTENPSTGELWSWKGPGSAVIVNMFTQEPSAQAGGHAGKATLESVGHCLRALKKEVAERKIESLAITRLATGVGGLPWEKVKPLVESSLGELSIPVYIYGQYQKGKVADER